MRENQSRSGKLGALLYARQSEDSQSSKDEQEDAGRARADREEWAIRGVYRDGMSASRHANGKRREWPQLLAELDHPDVGVLWLWESSRGDRTLSSWAAMLDRCREQGVRIYVETHGRLYDMRNAREWRTLAEDGVDSAYESEKVSVRVKRSMASNAAQGRPHGRTPYGYAREYRLTDRGRRELVGQVPDPAEAAIVRRVYVDLARGVSLRAIAATLNAEGVPSPSGRVWSPGIVRELALKACYAGKRSHTPTPPGGRRAPGTRHDLGELVDAQWPALVDVALWRDVRATLLDPRRRTSRPGRARHLLSMIAVCDVCDGPLIVRYRGDAGTYVCRRSNHLRAPQDELDEHVTALILARLSDPDDYERLTADDADDDDRLRAARDELAELRAHHGEMVALLAARRLSAGAFADAEPPVLADIGRAETTVAELESPTSLRHLLGDASLDMGRRWAAMPPAARRQVVRALFDRIALRRAPSPGHRGAIADRLALTWHDATRRQPAAGKIVA